MSLILSCSPISEGVGARSERLRPGERQTKKGLRDYAALLLFASRRYIEPDFWSPYTDAKSCIAWFSTAW